MMNKEAARLGMKNTRFANSTGLPHPEHYSTAHDLALLAAAVIRGLSGILPALFVAGIYATTRSPSQTAIACYGSTPTWMGSRRDIPKLRVIA